MAWRSEGEGGGHKSESRDLLKSQGVQAGLKGRESRGCNNLDTIFEVEVKQDLLYFIFYISK